jgi:hypothetical protein
MSFEKAFTKTRARNYQLDLTIDGVTHRGLVPACCHLQFSAVATGFFHVDARFVAIQNSSQSHLSAAIISRNNWFLLSFLLIRNV